MAQVQIAETMTVETWWQSAHSHAVQLEKCITTAPTDLSQHEVDQVIKILPTILRSIQQLQYPEHAATLRESIIRAITYLIHAYQELNGGSADEVEFYYSSALAQLAQLHYQLVKHGFAK